MTGRGTENVVSMFVGGPGSNGAGQEKRQSRILEIPLTSIHPDPEQPRKYFDPKKITELAQSIKEYGVIEPIGVRKHPDIPLQYVICFGERRWRATKEAGLETIPGIVIPRIADKKAIALIENIHRSDLKALELAMGIRDLMVDENLSMDAVGKKLGLGKTRVHQLLNILNLPEEMLTAFIRTDLNETHARALLLLKKYPEVQRELFQKIVVHGLTGNQALNWSEEYIKKIPVKNPVAKMVTKSIKTLTNLENNWLKIPPSERESYANELVKLREKIDCLLEDL